MTVRVDISRDKTLATSSWKAIFETLPQKIHYLPAPVACEAPMFWSVHESRIGTVVAVVTVDALGLLALTGLAPVLGMGDGEIISSLQVLARRFPKMHRASEDMRHQTKALLDGILRGDENGQITLFGTPFEHQVWRALLDIPVGALVSYKEIAAATHKPQGARAVGGAVGRNPLFFLIPCHRVIASDGTMGGYGWGLAEKRRLLTLEGLLVHPRERIGA